MPRHLAHLAVLVCIDSVMPGLLVARTIVVRDEHPRLIFTADGAGKGPGVPEPTTVVLACITAALLTGRRRARRDPPGLAREGHGPGGPRP